MCFRTKNYAVRCVLCLGGFAGFLSRILIEILNISIYHPDRMFYDAFDITRVPRGT